MSAVTKMSPMMAAYDSYLQQGFVLVPIAPSSKGPKTHNWNLRENCIDNINKVSDTIGVGLAHAYSGTMALDIDEWDRAVSELADHGIDLPALYDAPDCVTINSGNPGHAKLIYRMPFGMALTSKKLIHSLPDGSKKNYLDFRCATAAGLTVQDVLPSAAIHPVTCRHYTWGGNGHYTNLPAIPQPLLDFWQSLLAEDTERKISVTGAVDASWEEIRQALDHIDPSIGRDEWVQVGMALHYAGSATEQLDQALSIFDEWSAQSPTKYKGQRDILTVWKSFKVSDGGVKLGTLFHFAQQAGWRRPAPDVAYLFSGITVEPPKSIIDGLLIKPPICPIDHFPQVLVSRAVVIQREFAADPLVPIFAGLAAASAAADKRIRLRLMADWLVPPILWTMTVGSPSAKKTPAAEPMLSILQKIEKEDLPRYRKELQTFEALDAAYAASKKAYLTAAQDPNHLLGGQLDLANLPPVSPQPDRPAQLRLTVSDITSQKLIRMAADRPRGLVCVLDEMRSWAEKLSNQNSGESRSTWVEGYNCRSTTMDRVGDGKTDGFTQVDHFALGIHGNIQPRTLTERLPGLTADGLIQRFIFAVISDHHSDILNDPGSSDSISQLQYEEAIRTIHALPVREYTLSEDAYILFRAFQQWYIELKQDERLVQAASAYLEALGKIEGTVGRMMLIFHLLTDPHNGQVSAKTASDAITLTTQYLIPTMRYIYGGVEGIDVGSLDQWILDHVLYVASVQQTITLSEIRRSAKRQVTGMPQQRVDMMITDAMAVLEANGWATIMEHNQKTLKWALNPAIVDCDKEYRERVRQARQRIYDDIHQKSGGRATRLIAHD